jgi:DNA-binding FrmR family transcriptional regulator
MKVDEATCGCGAHTKPGRKAVAVDPEIKDSNLKRLRRIEGQIRGLQRMVGKEQYCADVLVQISSVQEALRSVSRELMRNHLQHCAAQAISKGTREEAAGMYEELLDLMYRHAR